MKMMLGTGSQPSVPNIKLHLATIYEDRELDPASTIKKFLIVQTEGSRQVSRMVDLPRPGRPTTPDEGEADCGRSLRIRFRGLVTTNGITRQKSYCSSPAAKIVATLTTE